MADTAQIIQVVPVSSQRAGVAIVRLADRDTERALRSAKALLLGDCSVSIFRSLPDAAAGTQSAAVARAR